MGAAIRAVGVFASHNQTEKRCRDRINALRCRSPLNPLIVTMLVTLEGYHCQGPTSQQLHSCTFFFYTHPCFSLIFFIAHFFFLHLQLSHNKPKSPWPKFHSRVIFVFFFKPTSRFSYFVFELYHQVVSESSIEVPTP